MPKIEQNGPNFKYLVTWKRLDDDFAEEETATVERPEAFHYVLPQRQPTYVPYEISVKAKNSVGDSRQVPKKVIGYSGEDGKFNTYTLILHKYYSIALGLVIVCIKFD